jgi:hypothetical protein
VESRTGRDISANISASSFNYHSSNAPFRLSAIRGMDSGSPKVQNYTQTQSNPTIYRKKEILANVIFVCGRKLFTVTTEGISGNLPFDNFHRLIRVKKHLSHD